MKNLEDYIVKILKIEGYINVGDVFWNNNVKQKTIGLSDPSFCYKLYNIKKPLRNGEVFFEV